MIDPGCLWGVNPIYPRRFLTPRPWGALFEEPCSELRGMRSLSIFKGRTKMLQPYR